MTKVDNNAAGNKVGCDPMLNWDPVKAAERLNFLYHESLSTADTTIQWYLSYRKQKGEVAKFIRISAIVLFVASTLMPLVTAWQKSDELLYLGYILASLGGGLLFIDQYYGYSTSWVRFVLTGKDLEELKRVFVKNYQLSCLANSPLSKEGFAEIVKVILIFEKAFSDTVKAETTQWAREFEQNMKDLIAALQAQGDKLHEEFKRSQSEVREERTDLVTPLAPHEVITEAYEKNYREWTEIFKVEGIGVGQKRKEGDYQPVDCLVFFPVSKKQSTDSLFNPIPTSIRFKSVNGRTYDIPTDVQPIGSAISATSANNACDKATVKRPGCSISRTENEETGTLGLKVYGQGHSYLLSCYHVLCPMEFFKGVEQFDITLSQGPIQVVSPGKKDAKSGKVIAEVYKGMISNELDCAIAALKDDGFVQDSICTIDQPPGMPIEIDPLQASGRIRVRSVGRTSGLVKGKMVPAKGKFNINYPVHGKEIQKQISGLLVSNQLSAGGDSGAAVLDEENNVIGMIIANSETHTYILPIYRILSEMSVSLKPN